MKQNKNYRFTKINRKSVTKTTAPDARFAYEEPAAIQESPEPSQLEPLPEEQAPPEQAYTDSSSCFLAILNANWDAFTASDALVLANSFVPQNAKVENATVYYSAYGTRQMELERERGPQLDVEGALLRLAKSDPILHARLSKAGLENCKALLESDAQLQQKAAEAAVHRYELQKLRYCFCVLEFSTPNACSACFAALHNAEIGADGCVLECQIVHEEDMTTVRAMTVRDSSAAVPTSYRFAGGAEAGFGKARPVLTWEVDARREKVLRKKVSSKELDEMEERGVFDDFLNCDGAEEIWEGEEQEEVESENESEKNQSAQNEIEQKMKVLMQNKTTEQTPFQKFLQEKGRATKQERGDVNLQFRRQGAEVLIQDVKIDTRKQKQFRRLKRAVEDAQDVKARDFAVKQFQKFSRDNPDVDGAEKPAIQADLDDDRFDFQGKDDEK
ncbi:hypothetical protein SS50377_24193 [Spironucleus salmonicida]|uniref:ESF1 RRM domain-containing protein n=1 Tax=Spironucleus salmonicida TaxID=348837 RepID=V6LTZ5_9EUKA|nr:hypothetical protein SS50377_24193 [Spironucleus salmonicida]|eukprot:EST44254.1 hypothetical protein SS50377_15916 [Spironucleus salmonicida]